jgi:two-component system, OmpR family, KDP operon response regulator KdpE
MRYGNQLDPRRETSLEDDGTAPDSSIDLEPRWSKPTVDPDRVTATWPQIALRGHAMALIVGADKGIRRYIERTLRNVGCEADAFGELHAGGVLSENRYDLALMSSDQERVGWLSVARRLQPKMPVLFLLENGSSEDVARLLEAGVDDCLATPFSDSDLHARVTRLFRLIWQRHGMTIPSGGSDFRLDLTRRRIHVGNSEIALTGLEYRTLWVLAQGQGSVLQFHHIESRVWGDAPGSDRAALRHVIHSLRRKLTGRSNDRTLLKAEPRVGYRLLLSDSVP